ncbi:MAG: hypothetical protein KJ697_02005 [Nanoarchaeota archaeon]|nr:hypothetical protein [Nanoarchaeota archaeon]
MTQIDFIMAIVVTLGVISFSIYYVSADYTNQMNEMNIIELKASADVLQNQLMQDITEDMTLRKVRFEEISGETHTESIVFVSLGMIKDEYKVFEGKNLITSGTGTITIPITLSPNQIRYFDVFYSGVRGIRGIIGDNNVTVRALSEQTYLAVSEDLCKNIDYDKLRKSINNEFKIMIGSCEIGLEPPQETVVVNSFPVVLKSLESTSAKIMVW